MQRRAVAILATGRHSLRRQVNVAMLAMFGLSCGCGRVGSRYTQRVLLVDSGHREHSGQVVLDRQVVAGGDDGGL